MRFTRIGENYDDVIRKIEVQRNCMHECSLQILNCSTLFLSPELLRELDSSTRCDSALRALELVVHDCSDWSYDRLEPGYPTRTPLRSIEQSSYVR